MKSNFDRYKKDLEALITRGNKLYLAIQRECYPDQFEKVLKKEYGEKANEVLETIPSFKDSYQSWYSEAKEVVKQLLPDRLSDFVRLYEKPKSRKNINYENYRIEDYFQDLTITDVWDKKIVGPDGAIPHFRQQFAIVLAVKARFESSLFGIRQLVQGDLFDTELEAAKELAKHKFTRAAGAVAGVVLERHLRQVCDNHNLTITKKSPSISDLNDSIKEAQVIDIPQWRFVQHLADIRNLCDHDKKSEPTMEQVDDLVTGVSKVIKTLY